MLGNDLKLSADAHPRPGQYERTITRLRRDHLPESVTLDADLSWGLLKSGGIMAFDIAPTRRSGALVMGQLKDGKIAVGLAQLWQSVIQQMLRNI